MSSSDESESLLPLQSYLELLRLPNVFTAIADVAMGFFFVSGRLGLQRRPAAVALADRPLDGRPARRGIGLALLGRHGAERRLRHRTRSPGAALSAAAFRPHPAELGPLARLATADAGDHAGQRHGRDAGEISRRPARTTSSFPGCRRSSPRRWPCSSCSTTPG